MIQPLNLLKKKLRHRYFPVNLTKFSSFSFYPSLYRSPPANYDYLCFALFSEILVKKAFWMILQYFRSISVSTVTITINMLLSKNVKILSRLSTVWSSSKKICPLSKRPPCYCWHILKILWKWPMYPDYFFSCDYDLTSGCKNTHFVNFSLKPSDFSINNTDFKCSKCSMSFLPEIKIISDWTFTNRILTRCFSISLWNILDAECMQNWSLFDWNKP